MGEIKKEIILKTEKFVFEKLLEVDSSHDFFHIKRVVNNVKLISKFEKNVDLFIVEMGALLHEMSDYKLLGDCENFLDEVKIFLINVGVINLDVEHLLKIISNVSFSLDFSGRISKEFDVVCDADKLDAVGAVGIARTFAYAGFRGNPIYDSDIKPNLNKSKEEYRKCDNTAFNHFYEKILKLPNLMRTDFGKKIALERNEFVKAFLEQFLSEVDAKL